MQLAQVPTANVFDRWAYSTWSLPSAQVGNEYLRRDVPGDRPCSRCAVSAFQKNAGESWKSKCRSLAPIAPARYIAPQPRRARRGCADDKQRWSDTPLKIESRKNTGVTSAYCTPSRGAFQRSSKSPRNRVRSLSGAIRLRASNSRTREFEES